MHVRDLQLSTQLKLQFPQNCVIHQQMIAEGVGRCPAQLTQQVSATTHIPSHTWSRASDEKDLKQGGVEATIEVCIPESGRSSGSTQGTWRTASRLAQASP